MIPTGPVLQYTEEPSDEPLSLVVYPGADGTSWLYEDDGHSFDYRTGLFSRISMNWNDRERTLTLELDPKSKARSGGPRRFKVGAAGARSSIEAVMNNRKLAVRL